MQNTSTNKEIDKGKKELISSSLLYILKRYEKTNISQIAMRL